MLKSFSYVRAKSLPEAIEQLSTDGAVVHAGGTDLLGCLRDDVFEARKVVSISRIEALRGITETGDGGLRIGALAAITQVANDPIVNERYPGLARAAMEVASPQLRNQGTIGGNLCQKPRCWYYRGEFHCLRKGGDTCFAVAGENQYHCILGGDMCYIVHPSDTAPALMSLGAVVLIAGPGGVRSVPIQDFFISPDRDLQRETVVERSEVVTEILLPAPPKGLRSSYRKVRGRRSWDFALAGVALALQFNDDAVTDARVVLSGAAPTPWRSKEVEEAIRGKKLDAETIANASEAVVAKADPLEQNAYKLPLFRAIIEEELAQIGASASSA